jgi:hypothetical protein
MRNKIGTILAVMVAIFVMAGNVAVASVDRHEEIWFRTNNLWVEDARCPEFGTLTKYVSSEFEIDPLDVDYMMWRESRCTRMAHNDKDPNGGSYGLFQINRFWCKPNKYTEKGFLQDNGVLKHCYELFDPYTNGRAFMAIFAYGIEKHGFGWGPWGGEPKWN